MRVAGGLWLRRGGDGLWFRVAGCLWLRVAGCLWLRVAGGLWVRVAGGRGLRVEGGLACGLGWRVAYCCE